jgi:phosphoribosylformylglycinamidine synthase
MILFFGTPSQLIYAVQSTANLDEKTIEKLEWLFGGLMLIREESVEGIFVGPRASMITPWSTNATEIIANMGIESIQRVEQFTAADEHSSFDPMLVVKHQGIVSNLI